MRHLQVFDVAELFPDGLMLRRGRGRHDSAEIAGATAEILFLVTRQRRRCVRPRLMAQSVLGDPNGGGGKDGREVAAMKREKEDG